nr:hypothetical protein [Nocardia gamkensis]
MAAAAVAEQIPFEVMLQYAVALPAAAAHVHDVLDTVEQFLADNRLVPAGPELVVDQDPAGVVRIFEHAVQQFERKRALGDGAACAGGQPEVCHRGFEVFETVLAGGIQFERPAHQGCAFGVEGDGVDLFALVLDTGVEVADLCESEGAAVQRFGAHLLLDVQALQRVHQVIHHVEHAFHRHGVRAFAEVFLGADEADAHLVELGLDDRRVEAVAEGTGAHVDDDVADFGMLGEVLEQIPEDRPLVDGLGRIAGLDELRGDFDAHGVGLGVPVVALGGDGQAIGVNVDGGVELLLGGNP